MLSELMGSDESRPVDPVEPVLVEDCSGLLEKPWRKVGDKKDTDDKNVWTEKFMKELQECAEEYNPISETNARVAKILLMGHVGAGKSSLINTIQALFQGRANFRVSCGYGGRSSVTSKYTEYEIRNSTGSLRFLLCDTRGIDQKYKLSMLDFNYILKGQVPSQSKLDERTLAGEEDRLRKDPSLSDKIHCVCFVLDAEKASADIWTQLRDYQIMLDEMNIPSVAVITKVEMVSTDVHTDLSRVYHCRKIKGVVETAEKKTGIPQNMIVPFKSYVKETETNVKGNVLALIALRQILRACNDSLSNHIPNANCKNDN